MFSRLTVIWEAYSSLGQDLSESRELQKQGRLINQIAFFGAVALAVFTIQLVHFGLITLVLVNLASLAGLAASIVLNANRQPLLAKITLIAVIVSGVTFSHLYCGFSTGFWLFMVNSAQVVFVLFAELSIFKALGIALGQMLLILVFLAATRTLPPIANIEPTVADAILVGNIVRAPVLLIVIAFYLTRESRQVESELRFTARQAKETADAKSLFLSNMSHELRTPLNAITGFAEILVSQLGTAVHEDKRNEFERFLRQVLISSKNLTSIIGDMLDLARIEANRIDFKVLPFNLREVATHAVDTARFYGRNQIAIETRTWLHPDLPDNLEGDAIRLSQILVNLLGNAMKFTHKGYVQLHVSIIDETKESVHVQFEIEDTGIGIPSEKLPYLFDSLSPVSRETAIRYGGTGLGLAITKQLVEMQGGHISVMSSPKTGSLFTVTLWFKKTTSTSAPIVSARRDLKGIKILAAEDNEVNQILIQSLIESWHGDLEIVENGLQALGRAQQNSYDLILMDLQMPFMDGIDAAQNIRMLDDPIKANVPIIALTADVLAETREKVFAAGMDNIVTKPINQTELFDAIEKALLQHKPDQPTIQSHT